MNDFEILIIPIYSMSEEKYIYKENRKKNLLLLKCSEPYKSTISENLPIIPWRFNQIVGYIVISYFDHSFWAKLFKNQKKYYVDSSRKPIIYPSYLNGTHFHISNGMSDDNVKLKIVELINEIKRKYIKKNWYIDFETLKLKLELINFEKILQRTDTNEI